MVTGISLFDILQILSMSRDSKVVEVRHAGGVGVIYIENGDIVHAHCGSQTGEDAVYSCLLEETVSYRELPWKPVESRTVNRTTSYLLLEAARLRDEKGMDRALTAGKGNEAGKTGEKKDTGSKAEMLVAKVGRIASVAGVILIRRNGEVMAGTGDNINSLRILTSMMVGVGGQMKEVFNSDRLEMIVVNLADERKALILDLKSAFLSALINREGVADLIKNSIIGALKSE